MLKYLAESLLFTSLSERNISNKVTLLLLLLLLLSFIQQLVHVEIHRILFGY